MGRSWLSKKIAESKHEAEEQRKMERFKKYAPIALVVIIILMGAAAMFGTG